MTCFAPCCRSIALIGWRTSEARFLACASEPQRARVFDENLARIDNACGQHLRLSLLLGTVCVRRGGVETPSTSRTHSLSTNGGPLACQPSDENRWCPPRCNGDIKEQSGPPSATWISLAVAPGGEVGHKGGGPWSGPKSALTWSTWLWTNEKIHPIVFWGRKSLLCCEGGYSEIYAAFVPIRVISCVCDEHITMAKRKRCCLASRLCDAVSLCTALFREMLQFSPTRPTPALSITVISSGRRSTQRSAYSVLEVVIVEYLPT